MQESDQTMSQYHSLSFILLWLDLCETTTVGPIIWTGNDEVQIYR